MSGEKTLETLLQSLSAELVEGLFVFVTLAPDSVPGNMTPRMMFVESEGITLIVLKSEAEAFGLPYEFPCRMITLNIHSSLDAVGFMARITTELAKYDMGVNPVSGFYHDHLFVPDGREADALHAVDTISRKTR